MIKPLLLKIAPLAAVVVSSLAMGHGWTDFPKARQTICADDGGYWGSADGSTISSEACRAAFLESGTYPFVQKNEFSANVTDYNNPSAIRSTVTDGNLCSAGSAAKSGMDIPSSGWQKTVMEPGTHKLRFRATAPHNPSFWNIYLTQPGFDSSVQRLSWADLELINSYGNLPVANGFYEMDVTIPQGREGTGILYVHWQRVDAAGEGFYNCSDIAFSSEGNAKPTPPSPDPDPAPAPSLVNVGTYVNTGHDIAEIGDRVRFRLFSDAGDEVVDVRVKITQENADFSRWAEELALKVNDRHQGTAFIGVWHDAMNHLMYDKYNLFSNRVWAPDGSFTSSTSVIKASDTAPPKPPAAEYEYQYPEGIGSYEAGTVVLGTDGNIYECKPFPYSGWCNQAPLYYAPGTGLAWEDPWIRK